MTFLGDAELGEAARRMCEEDEAEDGYVWDATKLWAHQPELHGQFEAVIAAASNAAGLSNREKAMLVIGQAVAIGDSYCCIAWSRWLAEWGESAETALAAVLEDEAPFNDRERALARWARVVAKTPNDATAADVERLRGVGFDDAQILALTLYTTLRMALSSTNDALGAHPDLALAETIAPAVREAITWGRQPA